ncbi:MAG: right-handed parallel beta-helix repeat-containing protein [Chitinophagaceae bacterium]|nr:right-handed parallel beta-helix repeat-containing protein [Anaerolineae bacterium]
MDNPLYPLFQKSQVGGQADKNGQGNTAKMLFPLLGRMPIFVGIVWLFLMGTLLLGFHLAAAQTVGFDESAIQNIQQVIFVNPNDPTALDTHPATELQPVLTAARGLQLAEVANQAGIGVRVLLAPGTYRESLLMATDPARTAAPIIIESAVVGGAIISGSDVWTGWVRQGSTNTYTHPWPYDWGLAPIPDGWDGVEVPEVIRRHEMIFVNGQPMQQVFSPSALMPDSFYVDEQTALVTLLLASAEAIETKQVEVSTRESLLQIRDRSNLILRGLSFQHASTAFDSAVSLFDSSNILVENNTFTWNNASGFGLIRATNAVTRGNIYRDNGGTGFGGARLLNYLSENETASGNNWRGVQGDFIGWSVAGIKHLRVHHAVYRNFRSEDNFAHGFWLDSDNLDVVLDNVIICGNLNSGLYLESSPGPLTVRNSLLCENSRAGIRSANIKNVTLENNIFYGNGYAGILFTGENGGRSTRNWETEELSEIFPAERYTLLNNILVGKDNEQPVIRSTLSFDAWNIFTADLNSANNTFYNAGTQAAFTLFVSEVVTFADWQALTGQDQTSTFQDVQFPNPDNRDFGRAYDQPSEEANAATVQNTPTTNDVVPVVVSFTLINADSDAPLLVLNDYALINLAAFPTRSLNIRADVMPEIIGSVIFSLNQNGMTLTENAAPYALGGGEGLDYAPWTPSVGSYTLSAIPYTLADGAGTAGVPMIIHFDVIDDASLIAGTGH